MKNECSGVDLKLKSLCIFHMFTAQLKTVVGNESAPNVKLAKVLENVKNVREHYEDRIEKHSIWESNTHNSIGLSSKCSACQSNWWLIVFVIFSVTVSAVVRHLLNLNFWVTSLQTASGFIFFGNLSTNHALSLTLDNFGENIDRGKPTPAESGFFLF